MNGHWQECDFFQEHSNNAIKTIFNTKNSEWDSSFLRDTVSVNITGLAKLRDSMINFLGLDRTGRGKSQPDYRADVDVLATHYLREHAFELHRGRSQECQATDMFHAGFNRLEGSVLESFLERTASRHTGADAESDDEDELEPQQEDEDIGIEIPIEPLIMQDGVLMAGEVEIEV